MALKPYLPPIVIILFLTLLSMKCKKDGTADEVLPPPTETGANTLGFYLNDKVWKPKGSTTLMGNLLITSGSKDNGYLLIRATDFKANQTLFIGFKKDFNNVKAPMSLNLADADLAKLVFDKNSCWYDNEDPNTIVSGSLTITKYDLTTKVIAGKFNATISKPGCDTLEIKDGRFDISLTLQ